VGCPLSYHVCKDTTFHAAHRLTGSGSSAWGVSGNVGACTPVRYIVRSSPRLTAPPRKFLYNTSSTRFATRAHFLRVPVALGMPPPPPSCAKRYALPRSAAQKYSGRLVGVKESLRVIKRSIAPSRTHTLALLLAAHGIARPHVKGAGALGSIWRLDNQLFHVCMRS
jgi:hypothetical protein